MDWSAFKNKNKIKFKSMERNPTYTNGMLL